MNDKTIRELAQKTRDMTPENRLTAIAAAITGQPATLRWSTRIGAAGPRNALVIIGTVHSGKEKWALGTDASAPGAREQIVLAMTVSLVHEAAACACGSKAQCSAFMAFSRATERPAAA